MKQLIVICGIIGCLVSTGCKKKYDDTIVSGIVTDSISGSPLHGVTMQLKAGAFVYFGSQAETITDVEGYYMLVYDTPSEGAISFPNSYEVFASKPGYRLKRAGLKPGTKSRVNFIMNEKYLQVKVTTYNFHNSDSTVISVTGEGLNPATDTFTFYANQSPFPEKNYLVRADTKIHFTIKKYTSGFGSVSTFAKPIDGENPITINLPV